jgi:hypothetical protein
MVPLERIAQPNPSKEDAATCLADAIVEMKREAMASGFDLVAYILEVAMFAALEEAGRRREAPDEEIPRR